MPGWKPTTAMLTVLALAACTGDPGPQQTGSVAYSATTSNKVAAAGVLGNGLGANLDERDRQRAFAAEMQALEQGEPGEPVGWRGGFRTLRNRRSGSPLRCPRRPLSRLFPHHLRRRPPADRARHRLPQSGRHLGAGRLSLTAKPLV